MTTCLRKSCLFDLWIWRESLSICVFVNFPVGFEGGMFDSCSLHFVSLNVPASI